MTEADRGGDTPPQHMTIRPSSRELPSLSDGERGLIISPIAAAGVGGRPTIVHLPAMAELRQSLMFWDKIDLPTTGYESSLPDELAFLHQEGTLVRSSQPLQYRAQMEKYGTPQFQYALDDRPETLAKMQIHAFRQHEAAEPGRWTLGVNGHFTDVPPELAGASRGLLLRLYQAIPLPDGDVPFADILAFKRRRASELMSLRDALDELYLSIVASPDAKLAELHQFQRLDRALADLAKATKSAPFQLRPGTIELTFSAQSLGAGATAGAISAAAGLSAVAAALTGAIATAVASVKVTAGLASVGPRSSPYKYVSSIHREF